MATPALQIFLSQKLNSPVKKIQAIGGGCISKTYKVETADGVFFCKINSASKFPHLFEKEKRGLEFIQKQNCIKTPAVINYSTEDDIQILMLEWIEEHNRTNQFWKTFGEQLASLHQISNNCFGFEEDNFMGSLPQSNKQHQEWNSFFIEQRLQPLLDLCTNKDLLESKHQRQFAAIYQRMPQIFADAEKPALVHGDLWSGNFMCMQDGKPVLIDPAVYFGHRSVDLAMTTLFGGFDKHFYESYHYHFPLPVNYKEQWAICNLYPLLIHLVLFGKTYLLQIEQTLGHFA
jgi:fructosamine-3-kinase